MPATKLNDVINPQVMGDMIEAKINAQAKLIPYAKVDTTILRFREYREIPKRFLRGITLEMRRISILKMKMVMRLN